MSACFTFSFGSMAESSKRSVENETRGFELLNYDNLLISVNHQQLKYAIEVSLLKAEFQKRGGIGMRCLIFEVEDTGQVCAAWKRKPTDTEVSEMRRISSTTNCTNDSSFGFMEDSSKSLTSAPSSLDFDDLGSSPDTFMPLLKPFVLDSSNMYLSLPKANDFIFPSDA
mmetsp:Transcript_35252/g.49365  ORF Transcript_35252/g.49365 Transcript_35252/m.49365 type:complete len:169 (-) Transcript_35252:689-1195(-)